MPHCYFSRLLRSFEVNEWDVVQIRLRRWTWWFRRFLLGYLYKRLKRHTAPTPSMNNNRVCYKCEPCGFTTDNKTDYERHLSRNKHIHKTISISGIQPQQTSPFICPSCYKIFKCRTSIYRHKAICKDLKSSSSSIANAAPTPATIPTSTPLGNFDPSLPVSEEVTKNFMTMMMALFQQNAELHNKMMEMCKNAGMSNSHNTNCVTNTNSNNNNNTFNMNMFLNEKCKDAMNMKDFVNSIQVNMTDLENVERLGYVQGMSNILINNLKKTDVYKRPVHCSDAKRETLYVKDDNQWERDGPDHPKMMNAVLAVEHKNVVLVNEWAKANPRCMNSQTRENEKYMKLSKVVMDGDKDGNIAKVIRKVAKEVTVEKD